MTPKEKAEELTIKMYGHTQSVKFAKFCAIVAVGELISEADPNVIILGRDHYYNKAYWLEVKKELEKPTPH
jgi:hypothetical protein